MIGEQATLLVAATALAAAALSCALFVVKVVRWRRGRARALRRAQYIGALGEMIARGVHADDVHLWARDPTFVEVVVEYLLVVAGGERERLEEIIRLADLRARLSAGMLSPYPSVRLRSAAALSVMADQTVEWALRHGLRDVLPEVRIQAASGLAAIGATSAIPSLLELLESDEPWVSARIADQLVRFGPVAVPLLLDGLRRGTDNGALSSATVQMVSRVLGLIGDLRACPVLRPMLASTVPEVRIAAASALGSAGTPEAVPALMKSLHDPDWRVRARAAASLAMFSDPASVQPLSIALRDESWWVRQNAAEALTEIPGGTEALIDAISGHHQGAREAAVGQLGLSGAIRAARDRVDRGVADPLDARLVRLVDVLEVRRAS